MTKKNKNKQIFEIGKILDVIEEEKKKRFPKVKQDEWTTQITMWFDSDFSITTIHKEIEGDLGAILFVYHKGILEVDSTDYSEKVIIKREIKK